MNGTGPIIVEFFGIPRQRAGRAELAIAVGNLADALAAIEKHCPGLAGLKQADGRPAPHYLLSLDGRQFVTDPAHPLQAGDHLLVLSADAGG